MSELLRTQRDEAETGLSKCIMQIKTLEREIALIGVELGCGDNAGTVSLMVQATAMKAQVAALTLALAESRGREEKMRAVVEAAKQYTYSKVKNPIINNLVLALAALTTTPQQER